MKPLGIHYRSFGIFFVLGYQIFFINATSLDFCEKDMTIINPTTFSDFIVPSLNDLRKGDSGRICVVGGSTEYAGAPYFAAISALKAGADLAFVITTDSAAPIIKSYSPDLIVYPYLHREDVPKIKNILPKMDIIVIGPGLGRDPDTVNLINNIITICKELSKPLVIDADGLYAISQNLSTIDLYPEPGVILTPNHLEAERLRKVIPANVDMSWYYYWGDSVSVLVKGKVDTFYSKIPQFQWELKIIGSGRRAGGQGDILAGSLGTFFHWANRANLCLNYTNHNKNHQFSRSIATNVAAHLTRISNSRAFKKKGRSMLASDMLEEIHNAFDILTMNRHYN